MSSSSPIGGGPPRTPAPRSSQSSVGIRHLGEIAAGYSDSMDAVSSRLSDPTLVTNTTRLAQFQIDLYNATTGYQLTARTIQDLHREDQLLSEMLRDA